MLAKILTDSFENFEDAESLKTEIAKLDPTEQKVVSLRFVQVSLRIFVASEYTRRGGRTARE